ncbi:MAG TPA: hypothetical protein VD999_04220 [Vitreimonas sp.]|nr:hypothetical protein [Vitreimonas sp.]
MELPNLFSSPAGPDKLLLAVVLTGSTVQAALWKVKDGEIVVVHTSSVLEYTDDENCLVVTDESLQELGKESEDVEEVVFGFAPSWVDAQGIVDVHKPLLKKLTKQLSLKAVGFVVIDEALFQELKEHEPFLSAFLIVAAQQELRVSVIHQGNLGFTIEVGKSDDAAADVIEALARATAEGKKLPPVLPAKMLLASAELDESEVTDIQQSLIAHDWVASHGLLHPPTVDVLSTTSVVEAITRQGGRAVAEVQGLIKRAASSTTPTPQVPQLESDVVPVAGEVVADELGFEPMVLEAQPNEPQPATPSLPEAEEYAVEQANVVLPNHAQSSFGVPIGLHHLEKSNSGTSPAFRTHEDEEYAFETEQPASHSQASSPRQRLGTFIHAHRLFITLGFIGGVLALLLIAFGAIAMSTQAQVAITLNSKPLSQEVPVTLDAKATAVDAANRVLPAKAVTQELSETKSLPTTGIKLVGDKAKGTVTLINKTESSKSFAAGTVLTAGKLKFVLDKEVTVASASVSKRGSEGENKTYGKADGAATAQAIGTESNVGQNVEFTVGDFSGNTYSAIAKSAFSGGASREARAVSEKDREKILADLKTELIKKAEAAFQEQSGNGSYTVPTGKVSVKTSEYSGKAGEEADTLTLKATMVVEGLSYQVGDLQPLAKEILATQLPSEYELSDEAPQVLSTPSQTASNSGKVVLQMNMSTVAYPKIDVAAWLNQLQAKQLTEAESELKTKAEVKSVEITLQPKIAEWVWPRLPSKAERIKVQTQ